MQDKIFQRLKTVYSPLGFSSDVLQSQAQSLASMGLVNDDNLETVVASQKSFLEGLQKEVDRRTSQARTSAETTLKKEFEAKLAEELERAKNTVPKETEPVQPVVPTPEPTPIPEMNNQGNEPVWLKDFLASQKSLQEAQKAQFDKLTSDNAELSKALQALQAESNAAKADLQAQQRANLILGKARELGIPQYRIDEGFNIPETADEGAITDYLTKVTNNIKAQQLPSQGAAFTLANAKADKAEADAIAKSLII